VTFSHVDEAEALTQKVTAVAFSAAINSQPDEKQTTVVHVWNEWSQIYLTAGQCMKLRPFLG